MELASDHEPIVAIAFDSLDNTVLATSCYSETISQSVDSHMMPTVDANFTFAVDSTQDRVRLNHQGVSMVWVVRILVGDGRWHIDWKMVKKVAALDNIDELKSDSYGHQTHLAI